MKKKLTAIICLVALLLSTFSMGALSVNAADGDWLDTNPNAPTDYAYSFAVIGDTQVLTMFDAGTAPEGSGQSGSGVAGEAAYLSTIYDWIVENKTAKKIEYVFGLGDITENITNTTEWALAKEQIEKLDGVVPYSVVRGNHDHWTNFNNAFNYPEYTNQFIGFFEDTATGYTDRLTNSYRTLSVGGHNYLLVTLDYSPTDAMLNWASGVIEQYPNHKVIITTHGYLYSDGSTLGDAENGGTSMTNNGEDIWNKLVRKHENIFLVMCGHVGTDNVVVSEQLGDNGNVVTQMLIDPQNYDVNDPAGMIAMLYFSADGKQINVEYYSAVKDKYFKASNQFTIDLRFDARTDMDEYGYDYYKVNAPSAVSPTVDGVINDGEYTVNNTVEYTGSVYPNEIGWGTDLNESFAYDAENIYLAFSYPQDSDDAHWVQLQFNAHDSGNPNYGAYSRLAVTLYADGAFSYSGRRGSYGTVGAMTISEFEGVGHYDAETGMVTYEFAIDIAALERAFGGDLGVFSYMLYDGNTATWRRCGHGSGSTFSNLRSEIAAKYGQTVTYFAQYVIFSYDDFDVRSSLEPYGQVNYYVDDTTSAAPTLDGVVNTNEYTLKKIVSRTNTKQLTSTALSGDLEEYFAHDDNYVYIAFVIHQNTFTDGNTLQFQFNALDTANASEACTRINLKIKLQNGVTTVTQDMRAPTDCPAKNHMKAISSSGYSAYALRDESAKTTTYEIKISKSAMKTAFYTDSVDHIAYMLYIPDGAITRYWRYAADSANSAKIVKLIELSGAKSYGWLPQYVHFSSAE